MSVRLKISISSELATALREQLSVFGLDAIAQSLQVRYSKEERPYVSVSKGGELLPAVRS